MFHFLVTIVIGFVAGLLARFLMPGNDKMGIIMTTLLGIGGSLLAGYLGQFLHLYNPGETVGFIASVIGAIILLAIYKVVFKRG